MPGVTYFGEAYLAEDASAVSQNFTYTASGGAVTGSKALIAIAINGRGGATTGSHALVVFIPIYKASGGITTGSKAIIISLPVFKASGGVVSGGRALIEIDVVARGGSVTGGTARIALVHGYKASNGAITADNGLFNYIKFVNGFGNIDLEGKAGIGIGIIASGGMIVRGISDVEYIPGPEDHLRLSIPSLSIVPLKLNTSSPTITPNKYVLPSLPITIIRLS